MSSAAISAEINSTNAQLQECGSEIARLQALIQQQRALYTRFKQKEGAYGDDLQFVQRRAQNVYPDSVRSVFVTRYKQAFDSRLNNAIMNSKLNELARAGDDMQREINENERMLDDQIQWQGKLTNHIACLQNDYNTALAEEQAAG